MKKKVLITNAVPVNNGDAALVFSLVDKLKSLDYEVTIATNYFSFVRSKYPEYSFIRELGDYFLLKKLPFLKPLFMRLNFRFNYRYRRHDYFISAPGGYLNSNYFPYHALLPLILAKEAGKKTGVYAQSVGPINQQDAIMLRHAAKNIDILMVRDMISLQTLKKLEYHGRILTSKDAAFLAPPVKKSPARNKVVGISVREWHYDARDVSSYINMLTRLVEAVLEKGYKVEFISTCQGIKGYKDDSIMAARIRQNLAERWLDNDVSLDQGYYKIDALREKLTHYQYVIGTRLHMCILSWLSDTPAFNISYEAKGLECYKYLGIPEYSIDYNNDPQEAVLKLADFLAGIEGRREEVRTEIQKVHEEVNGDLGQFLNELDTPQ